MTLPAGWPPRPASGTRSIRFYQKIATTTGNFSDNAYLFAAGTGANPYTPLPYVAPGSTAPVSIGTPPIGSGRDAHDSGADPALGTAEPASPVAMIWSRCIIIVNNFSGATDLELSFDGTNVHGYVKAGEVREYFDRIEAGIAVRFPGGGGAGAVAIEAW